MGAAAAQQQLGVGRHSVHVDGQMSERVGWPAAAARLAALPARFAETSIEFAQNEGTANCCLPLLAMLTVLGRHCKFSTSSGGAAQQKQPRRPSLRQLPQVDGFVGGGAAHNRLLGVEHNPAARVRRGAQPSAWHARQRAVRHAPSPPSRLQTARASASNHPTASPVGHASSEAHSFTDPECPGSLYMRLRVCAFQTYTMRSPLPAAT